MSVSTSDISAPVGSRIFNPLAQADEDQLLQFISHSRPKPLDPITEEPVVREVLREQKPETVLELARKCRAAGVII